MTMRWTAVLLFLLTFPPFAAAQESVVTGLSTNTIALNSTFDGSELFVFGAIRRDSPTLPGAKPLDIIITIKGPERAVTVRRKERWFGIWVNAESVRVRAVPSVYAIASTRPLSDLLTETEQLRYQIGMDQAVRRVAGHPALNDTAPFAEAVVRLRRANGLYTIAEDGVSLAEDTLFQARFNLPANLIEGTYAAEFFLVRGLEVINSGETKISVRKTGIESWIYNLAYDQPLIYGMLSVLAALIAGWLAATGFRLLKR